MPCYCIDKLLFLYAIAERETERRKSVDEESLCES